MQKSFFLLLLRILIGLFEIVVCYTTIIISKLFWLLLPKQIFYIIFLYCLGNFL